MIGLPLSWLPLCFLGDQRRCPWDPQRERAYMENQWVSGGAYGFALPYEEWRDRFALMAAALMARPALDLDILYWEGFDPTFAWVSRLWGDVSLKVLDSNSNILFFGWRENTGEKSGYNAPCFSYALPALPGLLEQYPVEVALILALWETVGVKERVRIALGGTPRLSWSREERRTRLRALVGPGCQFRYEIDAIRQIEKGECALTPGHIELFKILGRWDLIPESEGGERAERA